MFSYTTKPRINTGYNILKFGRSSLGYKHTEKSKSNIGIAQLGNKNTNYNKFGLNPKQ